MSPDQTIQPLNVAAATLLVQLILIALLAITSSICGTELSEERGLRLLGGRFNPGQRLRITPTLFVALTSFAVLLISEDLYSIWSPIFRGVGINTISAARAISIVFVLDLILVGYLIFSTGGSKVSPFLPALFTIPSLAIFLRLPPAMFFSYAGLSVVIFLVLHYTVSDETRRSHSAAVFLNIACLLLTMFTGYITRPIPINELTTSASSNLGSQDSVSLMRPSVSSHLQHEPQS